ncbi:low density lipoprotein receptor adapter protein 1-B-like isoform X2 [Hyperolius riggenbachi]|uniref:low density lipoprotein receptor adapter protein 1-B-like isoform X2 n=1 Tax=Hyperolius riggenbachi TaxID=752182 RepID=UPI0035A295A1
MDALKSVGKAILHSPSIARHTRRVTGHQKLPEMWPESHDSLLEGVTFHLKYLGMTLVEKPKGEDMAAAAIRRVITMARASSQKFKKVVLTVTAHGIDIQDAASGQNMDYVSIYRISYCTTDKVQNKVFAYVAQNQSNGALECHAFLSPKKKLAQTVTLTVAQAFNVALELWRSSREAGQEKTPPQRSQTDKSRDGLADPCPEVTATHSSYSVTGERTACTELPPLTLHCREEEEEDEEYDELDEAFTSCFMDDRDDGMDWQGATSNRWDPQRP